ncbi:hypothetical protein ScalyP_jg9747 [Parmales sp. scaly parma]|nr:hypothetical protein ScalyP_jg9747 [Parmales sp. scaly parma]
MNDCKSDTDVYTSEALASQEKFERELENHAEVRKALREARSKPGSEENGRVVAEAKLAAVETELAGCESLFNEEKKMLSENVEELEKVVSEKEKECNLLHEQYQNLAAASERSEYENPGPFIKPDNSMWMFYRDVILAELQLDPTCSDESIGVQQCTSLTSKCDQDNNLVFKHTGEDPFVF